MWPVRAWVVLGFALGDEQAADAAINVATNVAASASPVKLAAGWLLGTLALVLFTVGVVGLAGKVWRALRSNLPMQVRPRQLVGGMVQLAVCTGLFAALLTFGAPLSSQQSNLLFVEAFGRAGLQIFTPVRYAREVLATSYCWRGDAATPKLATWLGIPTSGYFGGTDAADNYIAAHRHPADTWSSASPYDAAVERDTRDEYSDGWGIRLAYEPAAGNTAAQPLQNAIAQQQDGPAHIGVISNVAPGSAAALAGVQRGDTLVSIDGEPLAALFARAAKNDKSKTADKTADKAVAIKTATLQALTKNTPTVLVVRSQTDKLITISTRKPYKTTGVQVVTWYTHGGTAMAPGLRTEMLYLRLNHFAQHTGLHAEADIRKSAQAVQYPANVNLPDPKQWPNVLLGGAVRTLVIDLRANGGGNVHAVGDLARRLLGKYLQPGLGLPKAQSDDNHRLLTQPTVWLEKASSAAVQPAKPANQPAEPPYQQGLLRGLKDIVVLTSNDTCSAAELLIHGLKQHLPSNVRFATMGDTTCGKPHGFRSREYFGTTIQVVDIAWLNAAEQPAYPQGITPTCRVKDLIWGPEGNDNDLVFQAAVNYVRQGKC